jgi:hypothetical protein
VAAEGWEAREGRSDEKKGANQQFMKIVADIWEPASGTFFVRRAQILFRTV